MPGERGPLPKANAIRRGGRGAPATFTTTVAPIDPEPPADLGAAGSVLWRHAAACSWVQASDEPAVHRLAQLEDERAMLAARLASDGPLLERPIVSPRGDVVGTDLYSHPLLGELRRIDAQVAKLRAELGLSPMTRARLGVKVVEAETQLDRLMRSRSADRPDPRVSHPLEALK